MIPHPYKILSADEIRVARDVVLSAHSTKEAVVDFREIYLQEPSKELMKRFLAAEHAASPGSSPVRPPRLAKCQYDIIGSDRIPEYHESIVDINLKKRVKHEVVGKEHQACLTLWEFEHLAGTCSSNTISNASTNTVPQTLAGGHRCSRTPLPNLNSRKDSRSLLSLGTKYCPEEY